MDRELSMEDMLNEVEASMKSIRRGQILKCRIVSIREDELIVNTGTMFDGIVSRAELNIKDGVALNEVFKEDEELELVVVHVNTSENEAILSKKRIDSVNNWKELEEIFKLDESFNIVVKEVVKGGVISELKGERAFIPASQLSVRFVKELEQFVGKELTVKIIEFDREKRKIVLSRREVEAKELELKRDEALSNINKGDTKQGVVTRLAKFGAFVDLGGVDGLIHISELSWNKVKEVSEIVSVGDLVDVYILDVDKEKNKISLTLKEAKDNPWNNVESKYAKDTVHEGIVIKVLDFGALVELDPMIKGLVHISQIKEDQVSKVSDILSVGDKVNVKVLEINKEAQKISLSIKDALEKSVEKVTPFIKDEDSMGTLGDLFGKLDLE
ncbi:MAG: 30S ribosomal protein S1 [Clostridium sp.]